MPATAQPSFTAQAEHKFGLFLHSTADMVAPTSLTHTQSHKDGSSSHCSSCRAADTSPFTGANGSSISGNPRNSTRHLLASTAACGGADGQSSVAPSRSLTGSVERLTAAALASARSSASPIVSKCPACLLASGVQPHRGESGPKRC